MWLSTVGSILTLALAIIAAPLATDAQRPSKVPRIGFLCAMAGPSLHTAGFLQGLRELGYIEGENIEIAYRFMEGGSPRLCLPDEMTERFHDAAAALVRQQVDVIV
ncbi:MAG: hypothetical protein ACREOH_09150, partial [Candidatus Entotheonellia bacterium]